MGRDRSLEEFFDATSEGSVSDGDDRDTEPKLNANGASESEAETDSDSESDTGNREPETDTGGALPESPDEIEPAAVTYRWDPGNVECAECGAAAEELWSGALGQVCAECKEW